MSSNIAGAVFEAMTIEERLTVCNMSIEAGARAGRIAPDDTNFAYLKGRPMAPEGRGMGCKRWPIGGRSIRDEGAVFTPSRW